MSKRILIIFLAILIPSQIIMRSLHNQGVPFLVLVVGYTLIACIVFYIFVRWSASNARPVISQESVDKPGNATADDSGDA
jgi:hypothetical protein